MKKLLLLAVVALSLFFSANVGTASAVPMSYEPGGGGSSHCYAGIVNATSYMNPAYYYVGPKWHKCMWTTRKAWYDAAQYGYFSPGDGSGYWYSGYQWVALDTI